MDGRLAAGGAIIDMGEPLVSVLMPVYNMRQYLRPSLQSILDQTYSNLEIIIVDDGSTDGSVDSIADVRDSRVRILSQPNGGRATALNAGLDQATGEFYATQDADDLSHPDRIAKQVEAMQSHPDLAAVFAGHEMIVRDRNVAPRFAAKSEAECRDDIEAFRMPAHDPTGMFRLSLVRGIQYEESLRLCAGWDYILRVGERFPMAVLGECLYAYRVHPEASTRRDPERRMRMMQRVLQRACDRRGSCCQDGSARPVTPNTSSAYREEETGMVPHFMESVLDLRRAGRMAEALQTALLCLKLHPADPYYYKPLAYFLAPFAVIERYRRWRAGRL